MARPRQFDESAVLDAAMAQFWLHGYAATSVRDLAKCTGLTTTSLYNAFGDKRALYRLSLDRYLERSFHDRIGRFESQLPPDQAIRAFFGEIIEASLDDRQRKGCLLVNTALEMSPHDREFRRAVNAVMVQVEAFFRRSVEAGQAAGTISAAHSADNLGQMLLGVLLGIRVLARSRCERPLLEGLVAPVLAMLMPEPPARRTRRSGLAQKA
jgi:TetR/AcrR family transcriptional repressor of nem operon